jgi:hypothetical protein
MEAIDFASCHALLFPSTPPATEPKNRRTEEPMNYGAASAGDVRSAVAGKYEPRGTRAHQSPVARRFAASVKE